MINYDDKLFDPLSAGMWPNKDIEQARAQMKGLGTGMVHPDTASLMEVKLGKEHRTQFAGEAADRMISDEAIMRGRQVVQDFWRELMMQTESVPAAQLHIAYQASQPAIIPEQAKNLAVEQGTQGAELASGFAVALAGVVRAFNSYCDEHQIRPEYRRAGLMLLVFFILVACGMPSIGNLIQTAQPPLETAVVAEVSTLVALDAGNAGAQGLTPSTTPKATEEPTRAPTSTPKATATEAAATATEVSKFIPFPKEAWEVLEQAGYNTQFDLVDLQGEPILNEFPHCVYEIGEILTVNIKIGDLTIIKARECRYKDKNKKEQVVYIPLVARNTKTGEWYNWRFEVSDKVVNDSYFDGILKQEEADALKQYPNGYGMIQLDLGNDYIDTATQAFLQSALLKDKNAITAFLTSGDPSKFPLQVDTISRKKLRIFVPQGITWQ